MSAKPAPQDVAFALAMFASAAQNQKQTSPNEIALAASAAITAALNAAAKNPPPGKPSIGNWQVVWGPAVPAGLSGYSVNLMYVAQNQDAPSEYMIAVGGTNFNSIFDSVFEDLFVFATVPWPYDPLGTLLTPGAATSLGTSLGLSILQNMTPVDGLPGANTSLVDFLKTVVKQNQKFSLTVAGHSLGGALAPTLALWLANTQQDIFSLNWDPFKLATIQVQAFAGPTPGNSAFASYLGLKFGAGLNAHYNTLDVVPHAWQLVPPLTPPTQPALSEIFSIYSNCGVDKSTVESGWIFLAAGVAGLLSTIGAGLVGGYTALPGIQSFAGTFNSSSKYYNADAKALANYMAQLGCQHIAGYFDQFNFLVGWAPWLIPPTTQSIDSAFSQAISDGVAQSLSKEQVAQNLQSRPAGQVLVGGNLVNAPTGPHDPQTATVVSLVQTELQKQGGYSKT